MKQKYVVVTRQRNTRKHRGKDGVLKKKGLSSVIGG